MMKKKQKTRKTRRMRKRRISKSPQNVHWRSGTLDGEAGVESIVVIATERCSSPTNERYGPPGATLLRNKTDDTGGI